MTTGQPEPLVIHLMSDLHFEGWPPAAISSFIAAIDPEDAHALVLAGDILWLQDTSCYATLERFARKYPTTLFVLGNHEFYKSHVDHCLSVARTLGEVGITVLGSDVTVLLRGHRIVGDTLWFPERKEDARYQRGMTDFRIIGGFQPWVYGQHHRAQAWLREAVRPGDIVVTHHLPHPNSVVPKWKNSVLNGFFLSDMTDVIERQKPALWLHGHSHDRVDFTVGATRICSNPLGYAWEGEVTPESYKPLRITIA